MLATRNRGSLQIYFSNNKSLMSLLSNSLIRSLYGIMYRFLFCKAVISLDINANSSDFKGTLESKPGKTTILLHHRLHTFIWLPCSPEPLVLQYGVPKLHAVYSINGLIATCTGLLRTHQYVTWLSHRIKQPFKVVHKPTFKCGTILVAEEIIFLQRRNSMFWFKSTWYCCPVE